MRRFFFHYREGGEYMPDDTGVEFESVELAYLDAFRTVSEMWPELMMRKIDPRLCSFEISDDKGNMLTVVNFRELLENCGSSKSVEPCVMESTFGKAVEAAHRTKRGLSALQQEIGRTRGRLSALREQIASIP